MGDLLRDRLAGPSFAHSSSPACATRHGVVPLLELNWRHMVRLCPRGALLSVPSSVVLSASVARAKARFSAA